MSQPFLTAYFRQAVAWDRLAHAYLLWGPDTEARERTVRDLALALVCRAGIDEDGRPCGACRVCREASNAAYAGYLEITGDKTRIDIEEIRELGQRLSIAFEDRRVVFMTRVERMTLPAANAFLKILEEPGGTTVYLMTSAKPANLLPTILSRSHRLPLFTPPEPDSDTDFGAVDAMISDAQALAAMDLADLLEPFTGRDKREKLQALLGYLARGLESRFAELSEAPGAERGPFHNLNWDEALELAETVLSLAEDGQWNVNADLVLEELASNLKRFASGDK